MKYQKTDSTARGKNSSDSIIYVRYVVGYWDICGKISWVGLLVLIVSFLVKSNDKTMKTYFDVGKSCSKCHAFTYQVLIVLLGFSWPFWKVRRFPSHVFPPKIII